MVSVHNYHSTALFKLLRTLTCEIVHALHEQGACALQVDDVSIAHRQFKHSLQALLTHNVSTVNTWHIYVYKLYVPYS